MESSSRFRFGYLVAALLFAGAVVALLNLRRKPPDALVVYCAHDSLYAERILPQAAALLGPVTSGAAALGALDDDQF